MKKIVSLFLALCLALGMVSVAAADDGFVLNLCIASEPETIDPNLGSSVDSAMYANHSYTVNDDQTVYTFTLRDDIFWSDGQPVKAEDFVYSWQRLVNPDTAADYGYFLDNIVLNAAAIQAGEKKPEELGIAALDDKTVQVTLESPCAYFLSMCAFPTLMPLRKDVVEGSENWTDPANIVVNGAYKVTEWVHDSYIKMEKNDKYYDFANLGPDALVWHLSDSETAILSSYQSGEYQFIDTIPSDMITSLKESGDLFVNPYVGTYYLYLNCSKITDWRVRAALVLSIDRENIVENVTQGGQVPATGLVASGILDSKMQDFAYGSSELGAIYAWLAKTYPDADLETYTGRCELAQKLYQEAVDAGAWDPDTTIVYNFNTSETHKAIAEACGSDWKTVLGVNITLENQEWATYTNGLGEHTFGVARLGWIADYNDAMTYLELMVTGASYNYGLYSNEEFDKAIVEGKKLLPGEERDKVMYNAEEILFSEGGFPVAPVYYYTQLYCKDGSIDNVGFTSLGYFFFQYATKK